MIEIFIYRLGETICKPHIQQRTRSRICKELSNTTFFLKKHRKSAKDTNKHFTAGDLQMTSKRMKDFQHP